MVLTIWPVKPLETPKDYTNTINPFFVPVFPDDVMGHLAQ